MLTETDGIAKICTKDYVLTAKFKVFVTAVLEGEGCASVCVCGGGVVGS